MIEWIEIRNTEILPAAVQVAMRRMLLPADSRFLAKTFEDESGDLKVLVVAFGWLFDKPEYYCILPRPESAR